MSGRNALEAHEKWAYDAQYAREAGLRMDAEVLLRTLAAVVRAEDVYRGKVADGVWDGKSR